MKDLCYLVYCSIFAIIGWEMGEPSQTQQPQPAVQAKTLQQPQQPVKSNAVYSSHDLVEKTATLPDNTTIKYLEKVPRTWQKVSLPVPSSSWTLDMEGGNDDWFPLQKITLHHSLYGWNKKATHPADCPGTEVTLRLGNYLGCQPTTPSISPAIGWSCWYKHPIGTYVPLADENFNSFSGVPLNPHPWTAFVSRGRPHIDTESINPGNCWGNHTTFDQFTGEPAIGYDGQTLTPGPAFRYFVKYNVGPEMTYWAWCWADSKGRDSQLSEVKSVGGLGPKAYKVKLHRKVAVPHGACGVHIYAGKSPNDLHRQPLPVPIGGTPSRYFWPVDMLAMTIHNLHESGIRHSFMVCESWLNPTQVALKNGNKSVIIDHDLTDLHCPLVIPYAPSSNWYGKLSSVSGLSTFRQTPQKPNEAWPLLVYQGAYWQVEGVHIEGVGGHCDSGITFVDPLGEFGSVGWSPRFKNCRIWANSSTDIPGVAFGCRDDSGGQSFSNPHVMSEASIEDCGFFGAVGISITNNQCVNNRWRGVTTGIYHQNGWHSNASAHYHGEVTSKASFDSRWLLEGSNARSLVSQRGMDGNITIQGLFGDSREMTRTLFSIHNCRLRAGIAGQTLNPAVPSHQPPHWLMMACCPNGGINLEYSNLSGGFEGIFSDLPNSVRYHCDKQSQEPGRISVAGQADVKPWMYVEKPSSGLKKEYAWLPKYTPWITGEAEYNPVVNLP